MVGFVACSCVVFVNFAYSQRPHETNSPTTFHQEPQTMKVIVRVPWKRPPSSSTSSSEKDIKTSFPETTEVKKTGETSVWNHERDQKLWTWLSMYPNKQNINCKWAKTLIWQTTRYWFVLFSRTKFSFSCPKGEFIADRLELPVEECIKRSGELYQLQLNLIQYQLQMKYRPPSAPSNSSSSTTNSETVGTSQSSNLLASPTITGSFPTSSANSSSSYNNAYGIPTLATSNLHSSSISSDYLPQNLSSSQSILFPKDRYWSPL
jgi:hypothetical protein